MPAGKTLVHEPDGPMGMKFPGGPSLPLENAPFVGELHERDASGSSDDESGSVPQSGWAARGSEPTK